MSCILLIEDNSATIKLIRDILELQGYTVLTATNADDGIVLARDQAPDLIVMDIQLPGTDGLTATRLLKNYETTNNIPVLALTAHAMRGDERRILAAGCDRYLSKPLSYKNFLVIVKELLGEG